VTAHRGIGNRDNVVPTILRAAAQARAIDYDADYGYPPAPRYAYPAYSGCGPTYPSCYSYGCRPAYSACGYYGGGCGGWMGYSRCGGC